MKRGSPLAVVIAACLTTLPPPVWAQAKSDTAAQGSASFTAGDVEFMSGMIYHHAQAVMIAGWAPSHGASQSVQALCERIVVGQRDEIALLQTWLRNHHQAVPDPSHEMMGMPGMAGAHASMPGMLTPAQLAQLDSAKGTDFDRLFLRLMIQHHQGAITMVNQLFAGKGSGEEETVYRMAANIFGDQTTEIARMQQMLIPLLLQGKS